MFECIIIDFKTRQRLDMIAKGKFEPTYEIIDRPEWEYDFNPYIYFEATLSRQHAEMLAGEFDRIVRYPEPRPLKPTVKRLPPYYDIVDGFRGPKSESSPVIFDAILTRRQAVKLEVAFKRICAGHQSQ